MYRLLDKSEPLQSGDEVLPLGIHYAWVPVVESGFGNKNWNAVVRRKIDNSSLSEYIKSCKVKQGSDCAKCIKRTWDAATDCKTETIPEMISTIDDIRAIVFARELASVKVDKIQVLINGLIDKR